jgi:hypothetical protein
VTTVTRTHQQMHAIYIKSLTIHIYPVYLYGVKNNDSYKHKNMALTYSLIKLIGVLLLIWNVVICVQTYCIEDLGLKDQVPVLCIVVFRGAECCVQTAGCINFIFLSINNLPEDGKLWLKHASEFICMYNL